MTNENGIQRWYRKLRYEWAIEGPVMTWAIVVICVAVWLVEVLCKYASPQQFDVMLFNWSFIPGQAVLKPWTWFTSMFMHDPNVLHVLCNMLTLIAIGPFLEKMLGHWCFLAFYTICGLGAADGMMVSSYFTHDWATGGYGASGALFGLTAMLLLVAYRTHTDIRGMLVWVAINFAMPLFIPHVAWQAHVGGFVIGLLLTWLLLDGIPALRRRPLWVRMLVYGAILVVLLVVLAVVVTPSWVAQMELFAKHLNLQNLP
ncbi:rhomboid family intramembrane serine protease [Bifidobacterium sp. ESL0800]|uniref:rhomboid family intramembrane serine protease n=1 Tax=Bifidobacterium sp. ESL0800 TaxID=2983236 RepID=UPI0023F9ADFE|nr:rhomboid family intramembrane serine protease [Bifidobacterium sp. ESL0800]WEV75371.1 rhomboid family intramembrane serine protease [Bifidobacterium sp. ESL0800]